MHTVRRVLVVTSALFAFAPFALAQDAHTPPTHIVNGSAIPPGAQIEAVLDSTVSTESAHRGDPIFASVTSPFYDSRGGSIVPVGAQLVGHVVSASSAGDTTQSAQMSVAMDGIRVRGSVVPIAARVVQLTPTRWRTGAMLEQARIAGGSPIVIELTQPVSVLALQSAESERAFGGGPRP